MKLVYFHESGNHHCKNSIISRIEKLVIAQ
jgi:hypothetical protein